MKLFPPTTHTQSRAVEPVQPGPVNSLITAICMGLIVAFVGTMYHAWIWYVDKSFFLPWGAMLALALCYLASVWVSLRAGKVWAGSLVGIVAFLTVALFAFAKPTSILVLVNPEVPVGLAGTVWMLGTLLATILANVTCNRLTRRKK